MTASIDVLRRLPADCIAENTIALLPKKFLFPRGLMCGLRGYMLLNYELQHGRVTVHSIEELVEALTNSQLHNCFICTHSEYEMQNAILSLLFIDIDIQDNLDEARKITLRTARRVENKLDVKPLVQFSGWKGYHVLVPCISKEIPNGVNEAKDYLRWLQGYLSFGYCDAQVRGDVNRLFRLPHTSNSKINGTQIESHNVAVIQEWNGKRADLGILYGDFAISQLVKELKLKRKPKSENYTRDSVHASRTTSCWIESLLRHGIQDGRHRTIMYVLAPYFVRVKKASLDMALSEVSDWIAKCNAIRSVNHDIMRFTKYHLKRVEKQEKIKFYSRLPRIQEEDPQLYSSISKAIGNDRQD